MFFIFSPSSVSFGSLISTVFFFFAVSFVPFPSRSDFLSLGVDVFEAFGLEEFDLVLFPDSGLFGDFPDSGLFGDFPDAGLFGDPLSDPFLVGDGDCLLGELDFDLGDPCLLPGKLLVGLCNRP